MSRELVAILSRAQRTRIFRVRLIRGEVFTLSLNLNAALDADAVIDSVEWQASNPNSVLLGTAAKSDRSASVGITAVMGGTWVKATVTADDGSVYTQLFEVAVAGAPWFQGDTVPASGPYSVSA